MARHVKPGAHAGEPGEGSHSVGHHDHGAEVHSTHETTHETTHQPVREPIRDRDAEQSHTDAAHEKFGGLNIGAAFFGWLVAIGVTILLSSIVGAVVAGIGSSTDLSQARNDAGTIGIAAAATLLAVLAIGYYAGGYVAGRMSRFDGARQGLGVWVIGLLVTILAGVLGAVFGAEYNILERVNLPRVPLPSDQLGWGGIITGLAVLVVTLLAAMAGGKIGHHYHNRVDRAAGR